MHVDPAIEEVLERLWTLREQGAAPAAGLDGEAFDFDPSAALAEARRRGWLDMRDRRPTLTPAGEERAAGVIRRHRLAERLLFDVIHVDDAAMEAPVPASSSTRISCRTRRPSGCARSSATHRPARTIARSRAGAAASASRTRCVRWSRRSARAASAPTTASCSSRRARIVASIAYARSASSPARACASINGSRPSSSRSVGPTSRSSPRSPATSSSCRRRCPARSSATGQTRFPPTREQRVVSPPRNARCARSAGR